MAYRSMERRFGPSSSHSPILIYGWKLNPVYVVYTQTLANVHTVLKMNQKPSHH